MSLRKTKDATSEKTTRKRSTNLVEGRKKFNRLLDELDDLLAANNELYATNEEILAEKTRNQSGLKHDHYFR